MEKGRIWLIGGTTESAQLATAIAQAKLPCIISVTIAAAQALYPASPDLRVLVKRFDSGSLPQFLQAENIQVILDASHPYATEISQLAIAQGLPYLRFERPSLISVSEDRIITLDSIETLLSGTYLNQQRVLLTLGYRTLPLFADWQDRATLFARILPSPVALETAIAAGFSQARLIALRPPIPAELEKSLWQHWQISLVVTKASGAPGGEDVKRAIATELGITLIVIDRPKLTYPQQTSDLDTALAFCRQQLHA